MRLRFSEHYVQSVPESPGIFCLWDNQHLVYVGLMNIVEYSLECRKVRVNVVDCGYAHERSGLD